MTLKKNPKKFFPETLVNKRLWGLGVPSLSGQVLLLINVLWLFLGIRGFSISSSFPDLSRQCFISAYIPFWWYLRVSNIPFKVWSPFYSLFLIWWRMVQEWAFQKLPSFIHFCPLKSILLFYMCSMYIQIRCSPSEGLNHAYHGIRWLITLFSPPTPCL